MTFTLFEAKVLWTVAFGLIVLGSCYGVVMLVRDLIWMVRGRQQ